MFICVFKGCYCGCTKHQSANSAPKTRWLSFTINIRIYFHSTPTISINNSEQQKHLKHFIFKERRLRRDEWSKRDERGGKRGRTEETRGGDEKETRANRKVAQREEGQGHSKPDAKAATVTVNGLIGFSRQSNKIFF